MRFQLYGACMDATLSGLPVYRYRSEEFEGRVDDSWKYAPLRLSKSEVLVLFSATFAAQWLAFVEESGAYGAERVQSLYSGAEAFVTINRAQYAAEIQLIYDVSLSPYSPTRVRLVCRFFGCFIRRRLGPT